MRVPFLRLGLLFLLGRGPLVLAQQGVPASAVVPVDQQWGNLQLNSLQVPSAVASSPGETAAPSAQAAIGVNYVQNANALRAFYTANPGYANDNAAMLLEAQNLVSAQFYGVTTEVARCNALVAQLRDNPALPADQRFSLASFADSRVLILTQFSSDAVRLAQFEASARNLIQEYPTIPEPYQALMGFCQDCADAQAIRIATDLLAMPAPQDVLTQAQLILNRYSLVGKSLATVLGAALPASHVPTALSGRITIVYAWSTANVGSQIVAKQIAVLAPAGTTMVGVNTDTNVSEASALVLTQGLPGSQLYDSTGMGSKVAQALYLNGDSVVIITNKAGVIATVSGRVGLAAKIQSAENQ